MTVVGSPGEPARNPPARKPSAMLDYSPTCVWPSWPVRRVAVLTFSPPHPQLLSAVEKLTNDERWFRWVRRGPIPDVDVDQGHAMRAFDELAPWSEWADVVLTDADDRSIAECVINGRVPAVGLPSLLHYPVDGRRSLELAQRWSSRGLALHLSLSRPSVGLLESAAGMRTRRRREQRPARRSA